MRRVLVTAYDINPYRGSESGTGWNFSLQLARFNKVYAITRKNNRNLIEKYLSENDLEYSKNIEFFYYDLPYLLRFWKRGGRGAFLYYNLWQFFIPFFILFKKIKFDVTQHINFHADHVFSMLWVFNKPFVWGPINHNEPIPKQFINSYLDFLWDRFVFFTKWLRWNLDPLLLICKIKANVVIGSNYSVKNRLGINTKKFRIINTVSANNQKLNFIKKQNKFIAISVGRMVNIKCFNVSIISFNEFYKSLKRSERNNIELLIVGNGPLQSNLKNLASSLVCRNNIKFIDWIDQKDLFVIYQKASVMLVPSQEGAGAVVAEGMSFGLPILCFNNFGAGELVNKNCGYKISNCLSFNDSCKMMANKLKLIYQNINLRSKMSKSALHYFNENLSWDKKGENLLKIYNEFF